MKFWKKFMKRVAARHEKARAAVKRTLAQEMTQSILAERKHWVEAGRAPRRNRASH